MNFLKKLYISLILIFLYAPITILIVFSFNESRSRNNWTGFSIKWYIELFKDKDILIAIYNTLSIAILSSLFATIIGTLAAIGINNMGKIPKKILLSITNLPVLNPDIVTGVSLMILYISIFSLINKPNFNLGYTTLLLSHITFNIPYVILSIIPKLKQLDKNLFEAALDLGATPLYSFYKIIIPQIKQGIITGAILSFTLSIDDFVVSVFTTGNGVNNLSTMIYSMTKTGINPKINSLSTILFLVVLILLYLINKRDSNKLTN